MNLSEWRQRAAETHDLTLTSGLVVKVKRIELIDLVASGEIPETLDALVVKATTTGFGVKDIKEFMPLVNTITAACLVEPAIADAPDDTHITLSEMSVQDRLDIFNWANSAADALSSFRQKPAGAVATSPNGRGVRRKTQRVARRS